ncbi:MAG: hypothetical protein DRN57_01870 [Thermoplasmata archaeon]|nr:MAG: hypothetical protein DRN57_01870 [Thermoplasmata archaeon]
MKWRALAMIMVVALASAMLMTGLYSGLIFDHSIDAFIEETNFPDVFIELSGSANRSDIEDLISRTDWIETYELRLKLDGRYLHEGKTYPAVIIGRDDPRRDDISKLLLKDGEFFAGPDSGCAVAGMEHIGVKTGSTAHFSIGSSSFEINISGTVQTPEYIFASSVPDSTLPLPGDMVVLYMNLSALRDLSGMDVNEILLIDHDGKDEEVVSELGKELPPVSRVIYQKSHPSVVFMKIGAGKMRNMFPLFSLIFMLVGIISIFMTFYKMVMNDSRFIGILMSLGYSRARIIASYMSFGGILALLGSILGIVLGLLFTQGIMYYTIAMMGDIKVAYPPDIMPFIIGIFYSLGSVMISVGIPIILVTGKSVREALEHKPSIRVATIPFSLPISRTSLMGIRNTFRNPGRTLLTILVIGMSVGVAGSWIVLSDSAWSYMTEQVNQDTWDLRVDFAPEISRDNVSSVIDMENTDYVIPFTYRAGQVTGGGGSESTFVVISDRVLEIRAFEIESGELDPSRSVITNKLASELGVGPGDRITITVGSRTLETTVGGVVYDILMHAVYLDSSTGSSLASPDMTSGVFIKLEDRGTAREQAVYLDGKDGVSRVTVQDDIIRSMDETFGQAMGLLYFFFITCLIISMVVAASAIIISTMERDMEFATLDTLGVPRSGVVLSMLLEIGIIGILSAILGVPFSLLFGKLFAIMMEEILYYFPINVAFAQMMIIFSFGLAFVLLSALFPLRYTRKIDVERTIRERTAG